MHPGTAQHAWHAVTLLMAWDFARRPASHASIHKQESTLLLLVFFL